MIPETDTRRRVDRIVSLAREGLLAEAALEYARFAYPELDVNAYLDRLAAMAESVAGPTHLDLRKVVAIREGLGGDIDNYYDPRNSYLNEVMDRRKGIPITLAVVWMEVGRRAGITVQGVGLPGHFLIYAAGQLVDPFGGGEAIGSDEAAALFAENFGGDASPEPGVAASRSPPNPCSNGCWAIWPRRTGGLQMIRSRLFGHPIGSRLVSDELRARRA